MNSNDTSNAAAAEQADGSTPAPAAGGFGELSRTIRSRTTDLLAVAIVLIGGLSLGTKLARWWGDDGVIPPPAPVETSVAWGAGDSPVSLEFGESPFQLQRQTLTGSREAVFDRLIEKCAAVADETATMSSEMHPAEGRLLEQLETLAPVRARKGVWQVYRIELPVTLIVATRTFPARSAGDGPVRRVVCWGMAQPAGEGSWVTYTVRPAGGDAARGAEFGEIALPAGSHKILSLRDAAGGALLAFEGAGTPREWAAHFSRWLGERNWKPAEAWSESAGGWSAAFVSTGESGGRIEVSISRAGERGLSGMVSVSAE